MLKIKQNKKKNDYKKKKKKLGEKNIDSYFEKMTDEK